MKFKPFIKTKLRDPQSTDFSKHELVVNINEGSLFFKSNKGIHKLTESSATTTTTTTETTTTSSPWTTSENDIYYNTGKVGIGTSSPGEKLEINGNILLNTDIRSTGALNLLTDNTTPHAEDKAYINIKNTVASTDINGDLNLVSNHTITGTSTTGEQGNYNGYPQNMINEWSDAAFDFVDTLANNYSEGYFAAGGIGNFTCEGDAAVGKYLTVGWSTTNNGTAAGAVLTDNAPLGSIQATGNVYAAAGLLTSDKKLKKNITPIKDSLNKILSLEGKNYEWKDKTKIGKQYGFIAQDVEKIIPELVSQGETKHLNYTGIIPLLVEAIKDQQKQIEELKQKIK